METRQTSPNHCILSFDRASSIAPKMRAPDKAVAAPTDTCKICSPGVRAFHPPLPSDVESSLSSKNPSPNDSLTALPQCEQAQASERESAPSMSTSQLIAFISITCASQLLSLSAMNQTVAPVMILARYFEVQNYGELSWFSAAYSMSVGTFILPAGTFLPSTFRNHAADTQTGRLGDMYGHKRIYLLGWLWFSVWSLITGFAYPSNAIIFSVFRACQGIGESCMHGKYAVSLYKQVRLYSYQTPLH